MIAVLGLLFVLAGLFSYLILIFVLHRFTYRTWIFDAVVGAGMTLAIIDWVISGDSILALTTVFLGGVWFLLTRHELRLVGSQRLKLREGDRVPAFTLLTTDGKQVTEQDCQSPCAT